jgi:hypothetical protein
MLKQAKLYNLKVVDREKRVRKLEDDVAEFIEVRIGCRMARPRRW